jgi:hypothetical protein
VETVTAVRALEGALVLGSVVVLVVEVAAAAARHDVAHVPGWVYALWLPATGLGIDLVVRVRRARRKERFARWCRWTGWIGATTLLWLFVAAFVAATWSR